VGDANAHRCLGEPGKEKKLFFRAPHYQAVFSQPFIKNLLTNTDKDLT